MRVPKPRYRCEHLKNNSRPVRSEIACKEYDAVLCIDCNEQWERGNRLMVTTDGGLFFVNE